jgi:hypothetical protein
MNRFIRRALGLIASAESDRFGSHAMRIALGDRFPLDRSIEVRTLRGRQYHPVRGQ